MSFWHGELAVSKCRYCAIHARRPFIHYGSNPKIATPLGVPTNTFLFTTSGVMNLFHCQSDRPDSIFIARQSSQTHRPAAGNNPDCEGLVRIASTHPVLLFAEYREVKKHWHQLEDRIYHAAMISKVLLFTVLVLEPVALCAFDTPATPNLSEVARKQADIWDDSDRPFLMDLDFTILFGPPVQGHLRLRRRAKDLWWSRISMGRFEQVKFQKGEWTYALRNIDFTPRQVNDLLDMLHVGAANDKLVTRAGKQRTEGGIRLDCLDAQDPEFKREHFQICIDSTTHDIVSETRRVGGYEKDFVDRHQFSNFFEFRGHRYPRRLEYLKDGRMVITASVTDLKEDPLDPKLLVPPVGAIERRECTDKKEAEVLIHPIPGLDPGRHDWVELDAELTVLIDGTVGKVGIVGRGDRAHDGPLIETLKKWKFKPAMCGAEPVVSDVYESFDYGNTVSR